MKNLLFILAFLLPLALTAQTETAAPIKTKKNTISASTYLGSTPGLSFDYRRNIGKDREVIIGTRSNYTDNSSLNIGFRKYYNTANKFSYGFGVDAGMRKRNIIGDNFVSRTLENTFQRVNSKEIRVVAGAYYKLGDRVNLMAEIYMKPLGFMFKSGRRTQVGLQYDF